MTTVTDRIIFSVSSAVWPEVKAINERLCGVRAYSTGSFPSTYVNDHNGFSVPSGTFGIVSYKPDIAAFAVGELDSEFTSFLSSFPNPVVTGVPGLSPQPYRLTFWHEGERANENNSPEQIKAMHTRAHAIVSQSGKHILYGQIFDGYSAVLGRIPEFTTPGLDFYGLDGYARPDATAPSEVFAPMAEQVLSVAGKDASIAITETNNQNTMNAEYTRADWFSDSITWLRSAGGTLFSPFYSAGQGIPWEPDETATITRLSEIW